MSDVVGFLEESPGVRSMARLATAALTLAAVLLAIATAYVAVRFRDAAAIAALAAPLTALAGGVFGALKQRMPAGPSASTEGG